MDIKQTISEIIRKRNYDWEVTDLDVFGDDAYTVTIYSGISGVQASFWLEFHNPGGTYSNSSWMLDRLDNPLHYKDAELIIEELNDLWFDIEDAFYGNPTEY